MRDTWGPGQWQDEPDRLDWRDERTGLHCAIRRHPHWGHLNGYVGIPVGHPFYGWSYHDEISARPEDYESMTPEDVGVISASGRETVAAGKGYMTVCRIALTEDEYQDWLRVEKEYEQWLKRIETSLKDLP